MKRVTTILAITVLFVSSMSNLGYEQQSGDVALAQFHQEVDALVSLGHLSRGQGTALKKKADGIAEKMAASKPEAAAGLCNALMNQINALVNAKKISQAQAQTLTNLAEEILQGQTEKMCPECGAIIPIDATECPECGAAQE